MTPYVTRNLHERVVDCNNEDLTGLLQLGVVDESRNVGGRAGGA